MAAISNQNAAWKLAAMQKAERLTDLWDIVKAWAGRAAEIVLTVCMFVSLVGMLPGVHYWTWVSNAVLAVQMIMLDFGGFALHTLAEHARDSGQDEAARQADSMANFLIGLVIATLAIITVGQLSALAGPFAGLVTNIVKYVEPVLILVRVVSSVKYIHVIHSLRGSTQLAIQPTQLPIQDVQIERLDQLSDQVKQLVGNVTQLTQSKQSVYAVSIQSGHLVHPVQVSMDRPVHLLGLLNQTVEDMPLLPEPEQANDDVGQADELASEAAQEDTMIVYPLVTGVASDVVKLVIDEHLKGVAWSTIAERTGKNYTRTIKPIKEAWTACTSNPDTSEQ